MTTDRKGLCREVDPDAIIEGIPLGVIVADGRGNVQQVSTRAEALLRQAGLTPPGRIGDLFPPGQDRPWENPPLPAGDAPMGIHRIRIGGRSLELSVSPLPCEDEGGAALLVTLRDVTESERQQVMEKRWEAHAVLEEWSAQMAHDIRNPLGSIELFASLLKKDLKRKKDIGRIDQIIAAARKVEKRISALILAGKAFQIPVEEVNVHEVLKDIMLFSERIIDRESVYLSVRYADIQPVIECNAELIRQVFLNLIIKALQAIEEPGRLDIETRFLSDAGDIEIHFIDNSPLARESLRVPIFDLPVPPRGTGAGLDLAIVHNIINMYRGSIRIESVGGVGTAFIISFPLKAATASGPAVAGAVCESRQGGNEKKELVDCR